VTNNAANAVLLALNQNTAAEGGALAKLASGSRIVQASDDASGLAIATQLDANVAALQQDQVNVAQGTALLDTADAGLAQISTVLSRMMALAATAMSGQVTDTQRSQDLDSEYQLLAQQINVIASSTQYAGNSLLNFNVTVGGGFSFESSSVLAGFYEAQVLRDTQQGADNQAIAIPGFGTFQNTGQLDQYTTGNGVLGLPTGDSGTFDAGPLESAGSFPFGPADFLVGTSASDQISVSIGAVNTVSLDLERDVVSYSVQPVETVNSTVQVSNGHGGFTTEPITYTAAQWLALNPTQALPGTVTTTVTSTVSNIATQSAAATAFSTLNNALATVTEERAGIGAYESRFQFTAQDVATNIQGTTASASVIADADAAAVKAQLSAISVTAAASVAALVQAASLPRELLALIQS
jgi:flagellin